jgi:hypothetical protein
LPELDDLRHRSGVFEYVTGTERGSVNWTGGVKTARLETIGAPKTADICRRAIDCAFPNRLPPTSEGISSLAGEFSEDTLAQLDALDADFFTYPHDLTELLYAYVCLHPEEFGAVPQPT